MLAASSTAPCGVTRVTRTTVGFRSSSSAAALIMLLVDLFKAPWLGSVFKKVPKRWRIAIPIILSGIAGVLSNVLGGIPWQEAVVVGLFAGPTAVFAHEAVVEAILGHARSRVPNVVS
jgi:hypothetical protein